MLSAPGKAFLAGEYAVLDGAPALVAGLDGIRLHATLEPAGRTELVHLPSGARWTEGDAVPPALRFARAGLALAARLCAEEGRAVPGLRLVFEDDLAREDRKLGLGGSAAATVIAVRAGCGRALTDAETLALSAAAHWAEQGGAGSGGDVAACALGGVLRVRALHAWRSPEEVLHTPARELASATPVEAARLRVPGDLRLLLIATAAPADSRALVGAVKAFAAAQPARWQAHAARIAAASVALERALERAARDAGEGAARDAALAAVREGAAAMDALGGAAGVAILTPLLRRACEAAERAGAAAKPSGAGGGDCAVALCFGDPAQAALEHALSGSFPVLRAFGAAPSPR